MFPSSLSSPILFLNPMEPMKPEPTFLLTPLFFSDGFLPDKFNNQDEVHDFVTLPPGKISCVKAVMKKLMLFFLLVSGFLFTSAQTYQRVAPGEYATYNIDPSGKWWASGGNPALWGTGGINGRQALPNLVQQQSGSSMPNFTKAYAGLDDAVAIDVNGNIWHVGG